MEKSKGKIVAKKNPCPDECSKPDGINTICSLKNSWDAIEITLFRPKHFLGINLKLTTFRLRIGFENIDVKIETLELKIAKVEMLQKIQ